MSDLTKLVSTMEKQFRDLQLHQMDALLGSWKSAQLCARPKSGWVRAVRETLGMSAAAFARRLGISHAGVRKLEASEASDVITLATLRKLAQALDCELQYALVPRTSLSEQIQERAQTVVKENFQPIAHSMALEEQSANGPLIKLQFDHAVKDLLHGSRRKLW